jgi:hypothetical protein
MDVDSARKAMTRKRDCLGELGGDAVGILIEMLAVKWSSAADIRLNART